MGLICSILESKWIGNCSNGGISSKHKAVVLVDAAGPFKPSDDMPGVKLVRRMLFGKEYIHAEPLEAPPADHVGWMASGCYIQSCDGRFPHEYPIPLHDRSESQKLYDSMSD